MKAWHRVENLLNSSVGLIGSVTDSFHHSHSPIAKPRQKLSPVNKAYGFVPICHSTLITKLSTPLFASITMANKKSFMDLPVELRLMVYEYLPHQIQHTTIRLPKDPYNECDRARIVFSRRVLPVSILCVSKLIHKEAKDIVQKSLNEWAMDDIPKITSSRGCGVEVVEVMLQRLTAGTKGRLGLGKFVEAHAEDK
jgi:hypothetical protein